jgi:predicted outer membrane repeat protein
MVGAVRMGDVAVLTKDEKKPMISIEHPSEHREQGMRMSTACGATLALAFASVTMGMDRLVPEEFPTITAAITASSDGDVILVSPGTYAESLDLSGRALTLRSTAGPEVTFITPNEGRCLIMSGPTPSGDGSALEGFTLSGGEAENGGAISMRDDALSLRNCTFTGNHATDKGGVLYAKFSTTDIIDCVMHDNSCVGDGGTIHSSESSTLIEGCTITGNSVVGGDGGGVFFFYADILMRDCIVTGNSTDGRGGGIYSYKGTLELSDTLSGDNTATAGAGVFIELTDAIVRDIDVRDNVASDHGGGICWVDYANGRMNTSTVERNTAGGPGGGVWIHNSRVRITDCRIQQNSGGSAGGLIVNSGDPMPTITTTLFCGNGTPITGPYDDGGGNTFDTTCTPGCPADLNDDGQVDGADLNILLGRWGACPDPVGCPGDINGDGMVDGSDLNILLGTWGPCSN